jgi:hypothetical protein
MKPNESGLVTTELLAELLVVFDELLPATDEAQKVYWFSATRPDGYSVILVVSARVGSVSVIVRASPELAVAYVALHNCISIRILDKERRVLDVVCDHGLPSRFRCVLAIDSATIIECDDTFESA